MVCLWFWSSETICCCIFIFLCLRIAKNWLLILRLILSKISFYNKRSRTKIFYFGTISIICWISCPRTWFCYSNIFRSNSTLLLHNLKILLRQEIFCYWTWISFILCLCNTLLVTTLYCKSFFRRFIRCFCLRGNLKLIWIFLRLKWLYLHIVILSFVFDNLVFFYRHFFYFITAHFIFFYF